MSEFHVLMDTKKYGSEFQPPASGEHVVMIRGFNGVNVHQEVHDAAPV